MSFQERTLTDALHFQYKVYLFERILLCCKEINPNKSKNKMLGANRPLVDKKGKLKLQLKGRIFMQNVTDVLTVSRSGKSSFCGLKLPQTDESNQKNHLSQCKFSGRGIQE